MVSCQNGPTCHAYAWQIGPFLQDTRDILTANGPLARYVRLRVAHAPGMPGTFSPPARLAIPTCITAPVSRTCRNACRDRQLAVCIEVAGGENVPSIPSACATHNFTYLAKGQCQVHIPSFLRTPVLWWSSSHRLLHSDLDFCPRFADVDDKGTDHIWLQCDCSHFARGLEIDSHPNQSKYLGEFRCVLIPAHCRAQNSQLQQANLTLLKYTSSNAAGL